MLAAALTRRVLLALGGCSYRVVFSHRVLLAIEEATGLDVFGGALLLRRCGAGPLRAAVAAITGLSACDAGQVIGRGAEAVRSVLVEGWDASMPEPEEPSDGPKQKPPTPLTAWGRAHNLGISSDEWLAMTPRMVHTLFTERLESIRQREFMMSRLTAITANFSMSAPKEPFADGHFMLHPYPETEEGQMDLRDAMAPFMKHQEQQGALQGKRFA